MAKRGRPKKTAFNLVCIHFSPDHYKAGDPPPSDYLSWHAWATAQHRAGLRQRRGADGKWRYPQEEEARRGR